MNNDNGVLIIAEQNDGLIHKVSYELLNKGKELADKLGQKLECLILGDEGLVLNELCYRGAEAVYYIKSNTFKSQEEYLYKLNIVEFIKEHKPSIVLMGATNFGRSLAPRIAAALNKGLTADCTDLTIDEDGKLIQIRPAFSDNILAHIKTVNYPQMATVRYKEFEEAISDTTKNVNIKELAPYHLAYDRAKIIKNISDIDFDITDAEVVVAGGRGIKCKEDIKLLESLAKLLGGVVGGTRALVDAGIMDSSRQIGYSGNRVKAKLYIACGISGAPQHIAGMKESEVIIAINNDPSAPIFNICNYGFVGNLYDVIPKIIDELSN